MAIDPVELERLSKAATQGVWEAEGWRCGNYAHTITAPDDDTNCPRVIADIASGEASKANAQFICALVNAYRTGQLVPAQPSGDVVEAVARELAGGMEGGVEYDYMPRNKVELREWAREGRIASVNVATQEDARDAARAAITAYEAVSGVAKMREALRPFVRHGVACGAFANDPGPFWIMTNEGHRDVPAEDFHRARAALGEKP